MQGLKRVLVENSEKRVAPLWLLKFDWMKVYKSIDLSTPPTPMNLGFSSNGQEYVRKSELHSVGDRQRPIGGEPDGRHQVE